MICDKCKYRYRNPEYISTGTMMINNGIPINVNACKFNVYLCMLGIKPRKVSDGMYVCRHHRYEWR